MKIGIIGAGNVGSSLGKGWAAKGHAVVFGVRDPNSPKTQKALAEISGAKAVSIAEAVQTSEVLVLAVPGDSVTETAAGLGDVRGKIIIDATNQMNRPPGISVAEEIAGLLPGAHVTKAFNTMGWESMLDPIFSGVPISAFICGDDPQAKAAVKQLASDLGMNALDAGPLSNASAVEGLAKLWVSMVRSGAARNMAFTMIRR